MQLHCDVCIVTPVVQFIWPKPRERLLHFSASPTLLYTDLLQPNQED